MQCWVCTVQHLRGLADLRGSLWSGHTALVDALAEHDTDAARSIVAAYNTDALSLIQRLAAG